MLKTTEGEGATDSSMWLTGNGEASWNGDPALCPLRNNSAAGFRTCPGPPPSAGKAGRFYYSVEDKQVNSQ